MTEIYLLLGIVGAGMWFWFDSLRARERATELARRSCTRDDLQFLDGTVMLGGLRLRRVDGRVGLLRIYVFAFTADGTSRRFGYVSMLGTRVLQIELDSEQLAS